MRQKRTWRLDLTDEQYQCIITGMELYHRLLCGDIMELRNLSPLGNSIMPFVSDIKNKLFPELHEGETYSWDGGSEVHYFDQQQAISYQIYREMRHKAAMAAHKDNVYSTETLTTDKADPIKVTRITK